MKEGNSKKAHDQFDDLSGRSKSGYGSPFSLALVESYLGEKDKAHEYLKMGIASREVWI